MSYDKTAYWHNNAHGVYFKGLPQYAMERDHLPAQDAGWCERVVA